MLIRFKQYFIEGGFAGVNRLNKDQRAKLHKQWPNLVKMIKKLSQGKKAGKIDPLEDQQDRLEYLIMTGALNNINSGVSELQSFVSSYASDTVSREFWVDIIVVNFGFDIAEKAFGIDLIRDSGHWKTLKIAE